MVGTVTFPLIRGRRKSVAVTSFCRGISILGLKMIFSYSMKASSSWSMEWSCPDHFFQKVAESIPDFTACWLQKRFMKWFNKERTRTVLTFPVETMALLTKDGDVLDKEYGDFTAEMYSEGHSFFTYMSDNADSLSSCCRLRNEIQDNGFSYTLGAGGVSTGSKSVLTINLNRCIQHAVKSGILYPFFLEEVVGDSSTPLTSWKMPSWNMKISSLIRVC